MKAIIIDDEKNARQMLEWSIAHHCPEVEVLACCASGTEGISQIAALQPELVFLDIQMRDMSGFDMLAQIKDINFEVIFTTAFDQYALDAFKVSAVDYLMKPIDEEELQNALQKVKKRKEQQASNHVEFLLDLLKKNAQTAEDLIALPSQSGLEFIEIDKIIYCQSDSNYTHLVLLEDKKILVSKTLKDVEAMLPKQAFFRVHNSFVVHLKYIRRYLKAEGGALIMVNGDKVRVSRSKKELLLDKF